MCKFGRFRCPRGISDRLSVHYCIVITGEEKKLPRTSTFNVPHQPACARLHIEWPTPRGSAYRPIGTTGTTAACFHVLHRPHYSAVLAPCLWRVCLTSKRGHRSPCLLLLMTRIAVTLNNQVSAFGHGSLAKEEPSPTVTSLRTTYIREFPKMRDQRRKKLQQVLQ